ncbi:MAG: MerR family transcriptional regulator [Bacteroidales bacterium]|nr:MerR family transcriptional regulator [Clostridium sp.]MCM1204898.1 MerR family transcriptional regulator [Bacteroidales bacterium]
MTAEEVSRNYHISMEKIKYYEENGLLEHSVSPNGEIEYTEQQIRCAGLIHSLINAGLTMEKIKEFMKLSYKDGSDKKEQIQILRKQRVVLLDEIHKKQQSLDELDYMIDELKKEGVAG